MKKDQLNGPLSNAVQHSVQRYFRQLNGEQVTGIYDMVLQETERPLLEVTMHEVGGNQTNTFQQTNQHWLQPIRQANSIDIVKIIKQTEIVKQDLPQNFTHRNFQNSSLTLAERNEIIKVQPVVLRLGPGFEPQRAPFFCFWCISANIHFFEKQKLFGVGVVSIT